MANPSDLNLNRPQYQQGAPVDGGAAAAPAQRGDRRPVQRPEDQRAAQVALRQLHINVEEKEEKYVGEINPQRKLHARVTKELIKHRTDSDFQLLSKTHDELGHKKKLVTLHKLGTSLNSVTILRSPGYHKKGDIEKAIKAALGVKEISNSAVSKAIDKTLKVMLKEGWDTEGKDIDVLVEEMSDLKADLGDYFDNISTEEFNALYQKVAEKAPNNAAFKELLKHLNKTKSDLVGSENYSKLLNLAAVVYSSEEIISHLQIRLQTEGITQEEHKKIRDIIHSIRVQFKTHIPADKLEGLLGSEYKFLKVKYLNEFVSRPEISVLTDDVKMRKVVDEALSGVRYFFVQTKDYAFKLGFENVRENLAANSANVLKLDTILLSKKPLSLKYHKFPDQRQNEGIASEWLEGNSVVPKENWKAYLSLRQQLAMANLNPQEPAKIAEIKAELKLVEEEIMAMGGSESIQMHGLLDLLYCSYDSHNGQYKRDGIGDVFNFDFSRFLGPSDVMQEKGELFVMLRSTLLDHPAANQPLSPKIIKLIQSWDKDLIALGHKELVGNVEEFAAATEKMHSLLVDRENLKLTFDMDEEAGQLQQQQWDAKTEQLRQRYGLPQGSREELKSAIEKDITAIRLKCFNFIHPTAFNAFMSRIANAKAYIQNNQQPTVIGLRDALYPQFKTFYHVLERLTTNAGQAIALHGSLELILLNAQQQNLATPAEIEDMQKTIAAIKQEKRAFSRGEYMLYTW